MPDYDEHRDDTGVCIKKRPDQTSVYNKPNDATFLAARVQQNYVRLVVDMAYLKSENCKKRVLTSDQMSRDFLKKRE